MVDLSSPEQRESLTPRGDPYTQKIARFKYLTFRKLPDGGTWGAQLQAPGERRRRHRIGEESEFTYEGALAAALEWLKGENTEVVASKLTLKAALSRYLTYRCDETEWEGFVSTRSLFNVYVFPHPIAEKLVSKLTTAEYQAWLDATGARVLKNHKDSDPKERKRKSYYTANHTWHWVQGALNRAREVNRDLPQDEWKLVKPLKGGKTKPRKVFLSEAELQRLINTTDGPLRDLILGGAYTGARLKELRFMRRRDLDLDEGIWSPSHSKTEKGLEDRYLDSDPGRALDLLRRLCAGKSPEDLVFTPDGEDWRSRHWRPFNQAVKRAKLPVGTCFYSLRHSYISKLVAASVSSLFIAENCGTSVKEIEETYGKFKPSQKRELLAKGGFNLVVPEDKTVVALR